MAEEKNTKTTVDKNLLIHWWHYYGKCIYTLEELEKFEEIIEEYGTDKVLQAAVASYVCGDGSPTTILASIRKDKVKELFTSLPNVEEMEKENSIYSRLKEKFVKQISETYNNN